MILYLDTSSLVKLYVSEDGSSEVEELTARAEVVSTSVVAFPEARSAFSRLAREGALGPAQLEGVREAFVQDWEAFFKVRVFKRVYQRAAELAEAYALRGFDALHLASFLEVEASATGTVVEFSAFDERLMAAARALAIARQGAK